MYTSHSTQRFSVNSSLSEKKKLAKKQAFSRSRKSARTSCPVCNTPHLKLFFEMSHVPSSCNTLWATRKAAQNCDRGDIQLAFCLSCGFITNIAFDPMCLEYTQDYENSLHYSPRFQSYAEALAQQLVERYSLYDKRIVEIGCGKGDFLMALCQLGNNHGIGFDPTYVERSEHSSMLDHVKFIRDFYSDLHEDFRANFIACRQVLEHVVQPTNLLLVLRNSIGDRLDTTVFFEVPNALLTFQEMAVWDIIYPHCNYFSPHSIARAFINCGFEPIEVTETFEGQFLCIEARPVVKAVSSHHPHPQELEAFAAEIAAFTSKFNSLMQVWQQKISDFKRLGKRVVVWGAGAKGITFLNVLTSPTEREPAIEYVVDINLRKQGMYVPGSGQLIVDSTFLCDYQPDVILVMNPIYVDEIRSQTIELGLSCELTCVC
jgi:2-polyprenyl-3-methyl-5-hydroxy-6-metoxy-1,4-benzoquinol methylase